MRKRGFTGDCLQSSTGRMSFGNFVSKMKIGGQPLLPPLVLDSDRPLLKKFKEEAITVEAKLAEQAQKRAEVLESSNTSFPDMDESCISNIDTEQVMNFIRQALKDSSHLEEVQHLQKAIFDELSKYDDCYSSMRKADSMDTLHNIDDFSNAAGSSREVSPSKSFPSAFPSPPKFVKEASPVRSSPGQEASPLRSSPGQEASPFRSSPGQETSRMVQSCAGDFAGPGPVLPESPGSENQKPGTPPKLIRRNSYTLESPSPSVLLYLKSLQIDDDMSCISEKTLSTEKSTKRNLNELWSEALSTKSVDASSATPMNQSAMSWKSEPDQLSNCDHLSLSTQVSATDLHHVSPPMTSSERHNRNNYKKTNSSSDHLSLSTQVTATDLHHVSPPVTGSERNNSNTNKKTNSSKCRENNNVPLAVDRAAAKIQAGVRGYLTRRLLKTFRVVELKNAIRDSLMTALQMHAETTVSKAELELHRRLTFQIESLCDEWHQIFFEFTPQERMRIIQVDRNKAKNPKPKQPFLRKSKSRVSMESSVSSVSSGSNSVATRPKSLPLMKPAHATSVNYKTWK